MAGAVAAMFGLDPVMVAAETDEFRKAFRVAAHNAEVHRINELNAK